MSSSKKSAFRSALDFDTRQLTITQAIIAQQKALLALIKTVLPKEIAESIQHCVHSGSRLLIYTASASWASQIRFYQRDILTKLADSGQRNINSLQLKISPPVQDQPHNRTVQLPSAENISLLRQQMTEGTEGDALQQALLKLASTLDKRLKEQEQQK
jgi:hypothetical protein